MKVLKSHDGNLTDAEVYQHLVDRRDRKLPISSSEDKTEDKKKNQETNNNEDINMKEEKREENIHGKKSDIIGHVNNTDNMNKNQNIISSSSPSSSTIVNTSSKYMIMNEEAYRNRAFIQTQAIYHLENYESGLSSCESIFPFLSSIDKWETEKKKNITGESGDEEQLISEMERLMLINIRPISESELHLVLEGYEERFTEDDANDLIALVEKYLINKDLDLTN